MKNMVGTPWSCQYCGDAFIGTSPDDGLCGQCRTDLQTAAPTHAVPMPGRCSECGGPVCPDCGTALIQIVSVGSGLPEAEVSGDGE